MNGEEILNEVRILIDNNQFSRYNEITRAYRRIAHMFPASWLREESEDKLVFEADTSSYVVNIEGMRRITGIWVYGVTSGDIRWNFVEEVSPQLFEEKREEHITPDGTDRSGLPEFFKILSTQPGQIRIMVVPTPEEDMDGRIDYLKSVSSIGRTTVPEIPEPYHDLIAQIAAGYILVSKGEQLGQFYMSEAMAQVQSLVLDTTANRTKNIDRPSRKWIRSGLKRYSGFNRYSRGI